MKKARKKRIVRRKRRISEREIMRIKRKLKKSARKLRLGAKRTGAYVYGTLRRIVGNPAIPAHMGNPEFVREFRIGEMRARVSGEPVGLYAYRTKGGWGFITRKQSMYRPPGEELVVLFGEKRGLRGNPYPTGGMTPLERLRYHVSGAIARGEGKPITDLSGLVPRKPRMVRVLGYDVVEGSKKHMRLLAQKRHFDDLQRGERGLRGNPSGFGDVTHTFLSLIDINSRKAILKNIADHYGISMEQAYREVTDPDAEHLLDYVTGPTRYAVQALMKRYRL